MNLARARSASLDRQTVVEVFTARPPSLTWRFVRSESQASLTLADKAGHDLLEMALPELSARWLGHDQPRELRDRLAQDWDSLGSTLVAAALQFETLLDADADAVFDPTSLPPLAWLAATRFVSTVRRLVQIHADSQAFALVYPILVRQELVLRSLAFTEPEAGEIVHSEDEPGLFAWASRRARDRYLDVLEVAETHRVITGLYPELIAQDVADAVILPMTADSVPHEDDPSTNASPRLATSDVLERPETLAAVRARRTLLGRAIGRHLLPRYGISFARVVIKAGHHQDQRAPGVWNLAGFLATLICLPVVLAARGVTLPWLLASLSGLALVAALWIAVDAVRLGEWGTLPWLVRLPASALAGLAVFLSFGVGPLRTELTWPLGAAFWLVGLGFLLTEVTAHGVTGRAALGRAVHVGAIGAMYGILVAGPVLTVVLELARWLPDETDAVDALLTATGWAGLGKLWLCGCAAFTAGVVITNFWDDAPVTAPLGRVSWR